VICESTKKQNYFAGMRTQSGCLYFRHCPKFSCCNHYPHYCND